MKVRSPDFTVFPCAVLVDSREQLPYSFAGMRADAIDGGGPLIVQLQMATLKAGDYSLVGHEERVAVERKSVGDLFSTLGQHRERFERELERLSVYGFAAVVVEAEWSEVLSSPPDRSRLNPKTIYRSVLAWQQRYPVHWWFVPGRRMGEVTTLRLLERFWRERQRELKEAKEAKEAAEPCPPQPPSKTITSPASRSRRKRSR